MTIVVSTDGSALGNPNGPMGWAWADHDKNAGGTAGHEHDDHGYDAGGATNGTNQIGELCAVLEALRAHPGSEPLLIESDSQYAINCSTTWVKGWKKNGWKNSQKKPVKNVELVKAIDREISQRPGPVNFKWVKGHAGNEGNELVDELARTYAGDCRSGARDGYLPIEGWQSLLGSEYARGTDVPPDVQLVLDGKADATSLRKPVAADPNTAPGGTPHQVKPSLEELLTEPEGVPDWGDDTPTAEAPTITIDEKSVSNAATNDTPRNATSSPNAAQSPAAEQTPAASTSTATAAPTPTQPAQPAAATPTATPTATPSGLTVSGALRFSPAPKTSPYFNGQPMPIRGSIEVQGYVDGDGNLVITNAPFTRH